MGRVQIVRETRAGKPGDWELCFQWCRYVPDDGDTEYGYRFIWRTPTGNYEATRGQALLPSIDEAKRLMDHAEAQGWGDRNGEAITKAAEKLRQHGLVVDLASGYVGWPSKEAAISGNSTSQEMIDLSQLIQEWS